MKYLFFILPLFVQFAHAQQLSKTEWLLKSDRTRLDQLQQTESNTITYLSCPFSESNFSPLHADSIANLTIVKVYYVYTQFKQNSDFNQLNLDRKRFKWLEEKYPFILADPLIEWQIIEQTGCQNATAGDSYFHGFILVHRPLSTIETREDEIRRINAFLENPTEIFIENKLDLIENQLPTSNKSNESLQLNSPNKNSKATFTDGEFALYNHFQANLTNSPDVTPQRIDKWISVSFTVAEDGKTDSLIFKENYPDAAIDQIKNAFKSMPAWTPATENGKAISSTVNLEIRVSYSADVKGIYSRDGIRPTFSDENIESLPIVEETGINLLQTSQPITIKSSAVYKGLELLRELKSTALVMDVTGSMTTHIAALTLWIKTNKQFNPFTSFTFFNDGDSKSTKQKKIGETGGIYLTKDAEDIDKTIKEAMAKGNGGEAPENDMEAVTYAFQHDENAHSVVLIGDNFSEVRDIELLKNINRPVHVLMCAAPKFIRCEYLKIAKDTGGLVLINGEKIDLSPVQKGDIIVIQKVKYKYNGDEFQIIYDGEIHY